MHDQTCVGLSTSIIYEHNFAIPMISLYQDFTVMSWSLLWNYICMYMVNEALDKKKECILHYTGKLSEQLLHTIDSVQSNLTGPVQITHNNI